MNKLIQASAPPHPLLILQDAVSKGNLDPASLEKLMDLQERFDAKRAKDAYVAAMSACQAEMPVVVKNATNTHTGFKGIFRRAGKSPTRTPGKSTSTCPE